MFWLGINYLLLLNLSYICLSACHADCPKQSLGSYFIMVLNVTGIFPWFGPSLPTWTMPAFVNIAGTPSLERGCLAASNTISRLLFKT